MKILLIHHIYTVIGGPERYMFNFQKLMEEKGHEVIPFSLNYESNLETPYSKYFPAPPFKEFNFDKNTSSILKYIKVPFKNIYRKDVYRSLVDLIKCEQPDVAYVLSYGKKLTISVLKACIDNNVPIIHRISDFGQLCAKTTFYRDGQICEECLQSDINLVKHKCIKNSYAASLFYYFVRWYENKSGYLKKISHLVFPSSFTSGYFQRSEKFKHIPSSHVPTFFDPTNFEVNQEIIESRMKNPYFCYIGRIVEEKGIKLLIDAVRFIYNNTQKDIRLKIYGFDNSAYSQYIKAYIDTHNLSHVIECYGFVSKNEISSALQNAFFSIVPSIWYDNMPNSLIESQSYGVPVIASDFGSFIELITNGENGYLFKPNDKEKLVEVLDNALMIQKKDYQQLCVNSLQWVNMYCSKEKHYDSIMKIFNQYIKPH